MAVAENLIALNTRAKIHSTYVIGKMLMLQQIFLYMESDHTERFYLPFLYVFTPVPVKNTFFKMMEMC